MNTNHFFAVDPYCQVIFVTQSLKTEIINRTLSPTWDQTLIFESVEIHGSPTETTINPPNVLIEVFDHDPYVIERKIFFSYFKNLNKII